MILAQEWIEHHRDGPFDPWVLSRLDMDAKKDIIVKFEGSAGVQIIKPDDSQILADRIVFEEDLGALLDSMKEKGQIEQNFILDTVRLPAPCLWLEFKIDGWKMGFLFEQAPESDVVLLACVASISRQSGLLTKSPKLKNLPEKEAITLFVSSFQKLPLINIRSIGLIWEHELVLKARRNDKLSDFTSKDVDNQYFWYCLCALFGLLLLQQPKLIETRDVTFDKKFQKKRLQKNKLPLLEYKRAYVRVGTAHKRAGGETSGVGTRGEPTGKRQYHHVLGHFRMYHRGTPGAYVIWIDEHWRGDPKLGVVMHERKVSVDQEGVVKQLQSQVDIPRPV